MKIVAQTIHGVLYEKAEEDGLLLQETAGRCTLYFALVVRGTDALIFPSVVLDDWGNERKGRELYRWIYDEGDRFPRAEVFGVTRGGEETQIFLRDLELSVKYPCYVNLGGRKPIVEARPLQLIFLAQPGQEVPQKTVVPDEIGWPLRHAAVRWRRVDLAALPGLGYRAAGTAE